MKVIFTQGLPASGKSTWAKQFCKENKDWIRINRDDLRNMRGEYWLPKQEGLITKWQQSIIQESLSAGMNVILDDTNLNPKFFQATKETIRSKFPSVQIETKKFDVPLEECIRRDLARPNSVGEKVIRGMYDKYLSPPVEPYTEDKSLPAAIIFDVDGTLAKMQGRGPFEWDKVQTDSLNNPVADLARIYHKEGVKVIIFTGRDGICEQDTRSWLSVNGVPFDALFIREAGNCEKDAIIKKRMFETYIRGKYNVLMVVDDRNQVVDMWRKELGLTCLQVDYGDF